MDFSGVTNETASNVYAVVREILALDISPADKQAQIARVIEVVGKEYHDQMFTVSSQVFDSTVMRGVSSSLDSSQAERLANKLVRNYALGRDTASALVTEYYNSLLGNAQHRAFQNAISMQKHPTLTRTLGPKQDCAWCVLKEGTHTNPSGSDFARHDRCDCIFVVSGYNTRNGLLANYRKV